MLIRKAEIGDVDRINALLYQVAQIHYNGRPDIFKNTTKKYSDEELIKIINTDTTPIFVAVDDTGYLLGYAFCIYKFINDNNFYKRCGMTPQRIIMEQKL